jgi:hypothetical protein
MDAANFNSLTCEPDIMVRGNFLKFRRVILGIVGLAAGIFRLRSKPIHVSLA